MKKNLLTCLAFIMAIVPAGAEQSERRRRVSDEPTTRFAPLHVYLDAGEERLAAYQFELTTTRGEVKIVGIEGGEPGVFKTPPYYDPAALHRDRVIIAAFSIDKDLPVGRFRVATIHLQIVGDVVPEYAAELIVAGAANGEEISAQIALEQGEPR